MGWTIIDYDKTPLQLHGEYVRDEALQARELTDVLDVFDRHGADGVFVMTFIAPLLTHRKDPRYDLDMASYSLVKSYKDRFGITYPDMSWEPKRSFKALARYFG